MKKIYLFFITLLLSYSVFAISQVYVISNNAPLKAENNSNAKTLISLKKNTELSRLTMHYSGWSQVSTSDNLLGWVLSDQLSSIAPKSIKNTITNNKTIDNTNKIIADLKAQLASHKQDKQKLIADKVQLQAEFDSSAGEFKQQLESLNNDNQRLKTINSNLSNELVSLEFDRNLLIAIVLLIGLFVGFIISIIFNKIAKNKRDSFNTIRRSY